MANAMLSLGINVRYVGALGHPVIQPVFEEFAAKTKAISLTEPGITTALEFKDGKLMFGNTRSLEDIDFARIVENCGEGKFLEMMANTDLVSIVNWTMIPKMTSILVQLVERVLPNLPPRDTRSFFFDLTDPAKRSKDDIAEVLQVISRFQAHAETTLGLNYNEALQVCETLALSGERKMKTPLNASRKKSEENWKFAAWWFIQSTPLPVQLKTENGGQRDLLLKIQKLLLGQVIILTQDLCQLDFVDFPLLLPSLLQPALPDTMCERLRVQVPVR